MFGLRYFVAAPFIFHKAPWGFSYGKFEYIINTIKANICIFKYFPK